MTSNLDLLLERLTLAQRDLLLASAASTQMPSENALRKIADLEVAIGAVEAVLDELDDAPASRNEAVTAPVRVKAPPVEKPTLPKAPPGPAMSQGTVKFFNIKKGFGFIEQDDGGPDVFVHVSDVERSGLASLAEGQRISFDTTADRGKTKATNLRNI